VGGDSGAWVIDNASGRVCGHVLAERDGMTYICSMQLLFEDMQRTLGATRVSLPGTAPEQESQEQGDGEAEATATAVQYATALTEDIAGAVAKLDLELDLELDRADKDVKRSSPCRTGGKRAECDKIAERTQAQTVRT